jgi:hypothetical protein
MRAKQKLKIKNKKWKSNRVKTKKWKIEPKKKVKQEPKAKSLKHKRKVRAKE